jgi:hypothetical protein
MKCFSTKHPQQDKKHARMTIRNTVGMQKFNDYSGNTNSGKMCGCHDKEYLRFVFLFFTYIYIYIYISVCVCVCDFFKNIRKMVSTNQYDPSDSANQEDPC